MVVLELRDRHRRCGRALWYVRCGHDIPYWHHLNMDWAEIAKKLSFSIQVCFGSVFQRLENFILKSLNFDLYRLTEETSCWYLEKNGTTVKQEVTCL